MRSSSWQIGAFLLLQDRLTDNRLLFFDAFNNGGDCREVVTSPDSRHKGRKEMAKHIGIVACSAEGAALCYRTICSGASMKMGEHNHPEISMHTFPLSRYMEFIRTGDWNKVAALMLSSSRKLAKTGAEILICPDNTIHQAFSIVTAESPLPWLHIADSVRLKAEELGLKKLAVLGTDYLMTGPVYRDALRKSGILGLIPEAADRVVINSIIFKELVYGLFTHESREFFISVIHRMKDLGCDGVIMGCTEIPLLLDPAESPLPLLDSTRLLAEAAVKESLRD